MAFLLALFSGMPGFARSVCRLAARDCRPSIRATIMHFVASHAVSPQPAPTMRHHDDPEKT